MPGRWLRQPHRIEIDMVKPLALLAAAFILLWAVVLQPVWETSRGVEGPIGGRPSVASRTTRPT
ncbi:hypothetical protein [Enterovirga aerilata]|uniref:Uncharacterized protein n=1 Tax=Enterovirga aerilata TaxID=2730920 RepID=A0A849IAN4_9HYPH|nr:hypothetical protein [Enterovirga sp. DB1703]NNM74954.1 hypothetical protein [Enterovirga sp. DB1703]